MQTFTRNNRQPLTMDQIRAVAPSAFASQAYHAMSSRYAYVPTVNVIEGMMSAGFQPFMAAQSRTKIEDKKEHTKTIIRALSARATDEMRYDAWDVLNAAIQKAVTEQCAHGLTNPNCTHYS